ncbi:MAG: hypothetical protein J5I92_17235 [Thiogranum sp.]|nr:hypothetical protein [Thiogranum sp.]
MLEPGQRIVALQPIPPPLSLEIAKAASASVGEALAHVDHVKERPALAAVSLTQAS